MTMKPSDATDELHQQNVFVPIHRLAELFSVIDGQLSSPADEAGLKARLADYMAINQIFPLETPDQPYLEALRGD
jgi:hypothetical protein